MPLDRQLFDRSLGEAVAALAKQRYPTAKALQRAWGIDRATAENVRKGHIGVRALFAAMRAEGWGFLGPLGDEVLGETFDDYRERKLTEDIRKAEARRENVVRIRSHREALERLAAGLDDLHDGQGHEHHG